MSSLPTDGLSILVADKDTEQVICGLLEARCGDLGIERPRYVVRVHPGRDPGCRRQCPDFLRIDLNKFRHALVIFDWEGSGAERTDPADLETEIEERLRKNGWLDRAAVIVIRPEVEAWVWSNAPELPGLLGWNRTDLTLFDWLTGEGYAVREHRKMVRPKEALRSTLRQLNKPVSSALFNRLARKLPIDPCIASAFQKLQKILRDWFPVR